MSAQIDWDFAGDDDAKAEISAAVRYLLKDAVGNVRGNIIRHLGTRVRRRLQQSKFPPLSKFPPTALPTRTMLSTPSGAIPIDGAPISAD